MQRKSKLSVSLFERCAMAFAGAVFGALTLAAYAALSLFVLGQANPDTPFTFVHFLFSYFGVACIVACALAGALLNPERLTSFFSFLWGTSKVWESPRFQIVAAAVLVIAIVFFAFHTSDRHAP